ncbi:zinc-ribbon domain-containing protein [Streptomyces sp. NPDC012746]|uniref:zinc-ribbon domain-containing protein n=1 Tax=Streptomyces sp. NPDC012746 TaxID=3364845 RepID=UPI003677EDF3
MARQDSASYGQLSIDTTHPYIANELVSVIGRDGATRETLHPLAPHSCKWRCTVCAHEWIASVNKRTSGRVGSGCPKCGRLRTINARRIAEPGKSLTDIYPQVAAEFIENLENELTAAQLKPQSAYKCRWRCGECCHEWVATPQSRTRGNTGCPACFAERRGKWKRQPNDSSRTAHEILGEIADEFILNVTTPGTDLTGLRPGSADKCDWICSTCGHTWVASVASRVRSHRNRPGSGCRKCYDRRIATHRRLPKEGESLNDRYPRISRGFVENLTTPGEGPEKLKVGSNDRCRWRCPNGHEWEALVLTRTNGSECPRCTSAGRSRFELEVCFLLEASTGADAVRL